MKETRYFYAPDLHSGMLSEEEAGHAVRVLHLGVGDVIWLTDGCGKCCEARITVAKNKQCAYEIVQELSWEKSWTAHLHLAIAPTKNIDRIEWLAEKATEIGFDELSFVLCDNSERKQLREDRIAKILVSAMKQSHKAALPALNGLQSFGRFVAQEWSGAKYIAHCYEAADIADGEGEKPHLFEVLKQGEDALVMIGPEGDFSIDEVRAAVAQGFVPISLGECRLRTETAGLVAVQLMNLANRKHG